ncbi:MAG TPA: DUF58 domain-containing protein [Actinotalea sp.]
MSPPSGDRVPGYAAAGAQPGRGVGGVGGVGLAWATGPGLVWSLGAGLALLVVGGLAGRADIAVLGVAPVLSGLWALWVRPRGEVWVDVHRAGGGQRGDDMPDEVAGDLALDGQDLRVSRTPDGSLTARLSLAAPPGTEAVRLRVSRPGHPPVEALVDVPLTREIAVSASSVRTGPQPLFRVEHQGIGTGMHLTGPAVTRPAERILVLPQARQMPALPLPSRLRGLSGQHEARRLGDGGGLRDIHPFQPGDTLRRIDWRVTARRSPDLHQLYVRRTLALAEAVVTLVVDSRDDVGPDPSTWSGVRAIRPDDATSLDLARQAAATVAQGYLAVGDRVGVEDLGVHRRAVRPGTGRRQLDRVLHQLALLRPEGDPSRRVRPPHVPTGSLVYLFSTFLDPEPAELAQVWCRTGHRVVAVDVLPRVRRHALDARERLALRIVQIERQDRLAEVTGAGADLVRWVDPGAGVLLEQLARQSHRRPPGGRR